MSARRRNEAPRRTRARRDPIAYVVEVEPVESDPKVAARVLAFLRARLEQGLRFDQES